MSSNEILYNEEFEKICSMGSQRQLTWRGKRKALTGKFGWAIPTSEVIDFLVGRSKEEAIVEVGAGTGYWAYEISRRGGDIVPVEIDPPEIPWMPVVKGSYEALAPNEVEQLLLCWPPANRSMAYDCVQYLNPQVVYFVGTVDSNIMGDNQFHDLLTTAFDQVQQMDLPDWQIDSSLSVFEAK